MNLVPERYYELYAEASKQLNSLVKLLKECEAMDAEYPQFAGDHQEIRDQAIRGIDFAMEILLKIKTRIEGTIIPHYCGIIAGELLLDIEARIGELLPPSGREEMRGLNRGQPRHRGKFEKIKMPEGINQYRAHQARTIQAHPDIVARKS